MVLHKVTPFHNTGDKIPMIGSLAQWMTWTISNAFFQSYAGGGEGIGKSGWYGLPYSAQGQLWHPGSSQLNCTLGGHTLLCQLLGYWYVLCPVFYRKWGLLFFFIVQLQLVVSRSAVDVFKAVLDAWKYFSFSGWTSDGKIKLSIICIYMW